jgi:hypothetical protein
VEPAGGKESKTKELGETANEKIHDKRSTNDKLKRLKWETTLRKVT